MSIFVYGLADPVTGDIRYIGKSIRPNERLMNHCNDHASCHRTHWIQSLITKGQRPQLVILQELPDGANWQAIERQWIAKARSAGWALTNGTDGGDGVVNLCDEAKAKMLKTWTGRKHKPESIAKMAAASRGRKKSEASKEIMRQKMTGRNNTWGDKVSKSIRKLNDDQVHEVRRLLSEGVKNKVLAEKYNVHRTTITNIKMGYFYADVPE